MTTKVTKYLSLTLLLLSIIPLRAQITLRGVVLDSTSRQGIALSSIVLHPLEGDTTANVATYTDLQGSYLITGLRSGTKYNVLIHARGYLDLEQIYSTPQDSTTIERTFVLTPLLRSSPQSRSLQRGAVTRQRCGATPSPRMRGR